MTTPAATGLTPSATIRFRRRVYAHYEKHGRDFPWRHTNNPYHILVSEVMLQQTQAVRVVSKYSDFITRFPDLQALAKACATDVLIAWQGLGYNRRALNLHRIAKVVCADHGGNLPRDVGQLRALPGIGPYSAAAIRTFAFNELEVFVETNIRTVYLHEFFPETEHVRDRAIMPYIDATLDRTNPRRWYQALMDYGAALKERDNASRRSAHHRPQDRFRGSRREARGEILRTLLRNGPLTRDELACSIETWEDRHAHALASLQRDGLVIKRDSVFSAVT